MPTLFSIGLALLNVPVLLLVVSGPPNMQQFCHILLNLTLLMMFCQVQRHNDIM